MLHAAFVLGNRLYGAGLFARYGHIDDGMVGAVAVADAATDAEIVVDDRFAGTIEFDGVFRAVGGTGPGHATFAEVGDLVVGLHARRAGFVDLYFHTARSLCTQQRPKTREVRGLNSIGKRSIRSTSWLSFHNLMRLVSNLCLTIITLLVRGMSE